ncbi:MAG: hypothetical protein AABY68_08705 [Pseudomonadota bacterium]
MRNRKSLKILLLAILVMAALIWWFKPASSDASITALVKPPAAQAGSVHASKVASTDLPPPGTRSLFDHVIAQNDGLPYPFEKLVKLLQDQHPQGELPVAVMIPHGRSLLKAQADNQHPRLLVAADFEAPNKAGGLGLAPRGQLFLGFVEQASEIEVLSYNEGAGRFEFQLVQNYCKGCVPRIVYARRAICTTCHQGGGPIFPQRPWNETNGQPEIAAAIAQARGTAPYMGIAVRQPLSAPERFDQLTDIGSFFNVTQKLWLDGCGLEGNDCRRLMLKLALRYADSPGSFDVGSPDARTLQQLQARHFPAAGIAVPESDLFNRDPLAEQQGIKGWWRSLWVRPIKPGEGAKNNEDLTAFDKLPKLSVRLDPLSLRPPKQILKASDLDGVYGLASMFSEADLASLGALTGYDTKRLEARVEQLPDALFAAKPFVRIEMLRALLAQPAAYCCLDTAEMSPPVASGVPPLKIVKHPELKAFEQYCFACHRGNPAKRLNFMAGAREDEVLANIQAKTDIREALDWARYVGTEKASKLMPPQDSVQYQELKAAQDKDSNTLARMRDVVPSLFGF